MPGLCLCAARLCKILPAEPKPTMKEKTVDELWNGTLVENFAKYDENGSVISSTMEDQKAFPSNDREGSTHPLASDMTDKEKLPNSSELGCSSKAEDLIHENENKSKNSAELSASGSDFFETDMDVYTDKNITECELPELVKSCKEVNYHTVKDICIDDGIPKEEATVEGGLTGSCLEHTKDVAVNERGTKGEDDKSLVPVWAKSVSEISFDKDSPRECDPKDSIQEGVTQGDATGKVESDLSEKGSFVNNMLPMQEFGTRSFLRSFLNSLNGEEKEVPQPLDQIPSGEAFNSVQSCNLSYNSKMESESITFNFDSPKPAAACSTNESIETVNEQSVESEDVHDHKDVNSINLSDSSSVQWEESTGNDREQRLKDENHYNSAATCSTGIEDFKKSPDHKNKRSEDQSLRQVLFAVRKDKTTRNAHDQALETINTSKHVDGNLKAQWDNGESSFSGGDQVTYSGPIPFSGSLSVRSDSSAATSTRSYVFSEGDQVTYSRPISFSGSLSVRSDSSAATSTRSFAFSGGDQVTYSGPIPVSESLSVRSDSSAATSTRSFASFAFSGEDQVTYSGSIPVSGSLSVRSDSSAATSTRSFASFAFSEGDQVTYSGPIPVSGSLSVRSDSSAAISTRSFAFSGGDQVTYSGPIPFSGSLSVRSDSNAATSTRSFAFPVLQPERNNSHVRMAKSDRQHFRKHKDWISGLLCCRF